MDPSPRCAGARNVRGRRKRSGPRNCLAARGVARRLARALRTSRTGSSGRRASQNRQAFAQRAEGERRPSGRLGASLCAVASRSPPRPKSSRCASGSTRPRASRRATTSRRARTCSRCARTRAAGAPRFAAALGPRAGVVRSGGGIGERAADQRARGDGRERPAFRDAFRARRCIVPASGFYEWASRGDFRQPYWIAPNDGAPFGIAGLWERWIAPDGARLESCALLTTAANARIADAARPHARDPRAGRLRGLARSRARRRRRSPELLAPLASDALALRPVGTRVNRVENDDAALLDAVPEPPRQPSLFG